MADGRPDNRWRELLFWSAIAALVFGLPASVVTSLARQHWAIQGLAKLKQSVKELSRSPRVQRHSLSPPGGILSPTGGIRGGFDFDSEIQYSIALPDVLAVERSQPSFSPFPNLDVEIYAPDPNRGRDSRTSTKANLVTQVVTLTSRLNAVHSLHMISPETGRLLERTWDIRELCVENPVRYPATKDSWNDVDLSRIDQSMPRLHILTLSGINWSKPIDFPEQGFNDLVALEARHATSERWKLSKRRGLKYVRLGYNIKELIVSDCPDIERLAMTQGVEGSIVIQHLPRLKGLSLRHVSYWPDYSGLKLDCLLADLPELETIFLEGDIRATHLQQLVDMPKLKRVGLRVRRFDAAMLDKLLEIKTMEELHLSAGKVRARLARLASHPSLNDLQLHVDGWEHNDDWESDMTAAFELNTLKENRGIRVEVLKDTY